MLLGNGAEPADLWGLVTKGKDLFLSDPGREQFKLVIYVERKQHFFPILLPSFLLRSTYRATGVTSDSHLQCVSSG